MLDAIHPWGRPLRPSLASQFMARVASEPWQLEGYFRLRAAVFAEEQELFAKSDLDEHDAAAVPIVAVSLNAGMPERVVGVVRVFETEGGTWYGGRLGVDREYRQRGAIGTALITRAVCTAHGLGCTRFLATVQEQNARYFERHHFARVDTLLVLGRRHVLMEADLARYPAVPSAVEPPGLGQLSVREVA